MKKLLLLILFLTPALASAEYMDVIKFKLTDECSFGEYLEIKNDFNSQWGKANGYTSRVAMALQHDKLGTENTQHKQIALDNFSVETTALLIACKRPQPRTAVAIFFFLHILYIYIHIYTRTPVFK